MRLSTAITTLAAIFLSLPYATLAREAKTIQTTGPNSPAINVNGPHAISEVNYYISNNGNSKSDEHFELAQNYFKEQLYNKAINELQKAIIVNPRHVPSKELLAEILWVNKNNSAGAKEELVSIKDILSNDGKILLMLLYYNDGNFEKSFEISSRINPNGASIKLAQHFYVRKAELLIKRSNKLELRDFITTSVDELNQRSYKLVAHKIHENPYSITKIGGPFAPVDYLQASSARFALAFFSAICFENDDTDKIKNIKASHAEHGIGISSNGQFAVTPSMATNFLRTIMTNFNASRKLTRSDIKLAYDWGKQISSALKGSIEFISPGCEETKITLSINTGATSEHIRLVDSVIEEYKKHFNLDDSGNYISATNVRLPKQ